MLKHFLRKSSSEKNIESWNHHQRRNREIEEENTSTAYQRNRPKKLINNVHRHQHHRLGHQSAHRHIIGASMEKMSSYEKWNGNGREEMAQSRKILIDPREMSSHRLSSSKWLRYIIFIIVEGTNRNRRQCLHRHIWKCLRTSVHQASIENRPTSATAHLCIIIRSVIGNHGPHIGEEIITNISEMATIMLHRRKCRRNDSCYIEIFCIFEEVMSSHRYVITAKIAWKWK